MDEQDIRHSPDSQQFTLSIDGHTAVLEYRQVNDKVLDYTRTYVPVEIRHRGIARRLTTHALEYAANHNLKVIPTCWFVAKVMGENSAFTDLTTSS